MLFRESHHQEEEHVRRSAERRFRTVGGSGSRTSSQMILERSELSHRKTWTKVQSFKVLIQKEIRTCESGGGKIRIRGSGGPDSSAVVRTWRPPWRCQRHGGELCFSCKRVKTVNFLKAGGSKTFCFPQMLTALRKTLFCRLSSSC